MLHQSLLLLAAGGLCFAECSQSTIKGTWTHYSQVKIFSSATSTPVLFANVALANVDYQGNFSGPLWVNIDGRVLKGEWGGTITVNPDCTAMAKHHVVGIPGEATERVWILDGAREMAGMATIGEIGKPTGLSHYRRVSRGDPAWGNPGCTSDMVRGVYAGTYEGNFFLPSTGQTATPTPFSMISALTFDHNGAGSGKATMSVAGYVHEIVFAEASISVNADCSAVGNWRDAANGSGKDQMIILNNGDEIISMPVHNSRGSPLMIGTLKRVSMTPVPPIW
jgi:hypothetical protein